MSKASAIELMHLRSLWEQDPGRAHVCPNCLAVRKGTIADGEHASWCARKRDVAAMERNAADYEVAI